MTETTPPLTPYPFDLMMGRIAHEWETRKRILDLPSARFWHPDPEVDLSFDFLGRRAATPIGPAAGPHTQMAQNIVLAWLGGSRLFELKTVQVLDDLHINRPCIDMQTIGFNIEWSQELSVPQSVEEYVKAWMAIELLRRWDPIAELLGPGPGAHIFDMSVGYDLAGIQTEKVARFVDTMSDASAEIERLRPLIPAPFDASVEFPSRVADTVTLSTFHGCPPEEIEGITKHLMTRHGVDVIVKLNPTLLGFGRVCEILQETLGYRHVRLDRQPFVDDLQFDRALVLIDGLRRFATDHGRRFGIKLTNTLVVQNWKGFLPDDPMYLSGPPLHVLATTLLDELINNLPGTFRVGGHGGDVQVSFSAGVTKENLSETVGMGVGPVTICSDLLKPGGFGRLEPMLRRLAADMKEAGTTTLAAWHHHCWEAARAAGHRGPVEMHMKRMIEGDLLESYHLRSHEKLPRAVDHTLQMWGCVACNFCVTVCPNDAFFRIPTPEGSGIEGRQQYLLLAELCNECGNCMVFCPEEGDPAQIKPKLYLDPERFAAAVGPAFHVTRSDGGVTAQPKPGYEQEVPLLLELLNADPEGIPTGAAHL
jgi:putative selenate reductase